MDPVPWIAVGIAGFTAVTSWLLSRRAAAERETQESIALKIADDKAQLDATQQALNAYEILNGTHQREIARMVEQTDTLAAMLRLERERGHAAQMDHTKVIARYRLTLMELLDALTVVRNLVEPKDAQEIDHAMLSATETMKGEPDEDE